MGHSPACIVSSCVNAKLSGKLGRHIFTVHVYFREQIVANLGEEKAAELLATLPTNTASAPLEEDLSSPLAARAKQAPKPQPAGKQSLHEFG